MTPREKLLLDFFGNFVWVTAALTIFTLWAHGVI